MPRMCSELCRRGAKPPPAPAETLNAYGPFVDGWLTGLTVGTVMLLFLSSRSLAADREGGLLRQALLHSCPRGSLVWGRALLGLPLVLGVLVVTGGAAAVTAGALFEFGPVIEDGYELVASDEIHSELWRAVLVTLPTLLAVWAFGLATSACLGTGSSALATGLGTYLAFDLFKGVLAEGQYWSFAAFAPSFVDNSYLAEVSQIVRGYSDAGFSPELFARNLWLPWPQALLLVFLATFVLKRRGL